MDKKQLREQYARYLFLFQRRYVIVAQCKCANGPCVTWSVISQWRKAVNHFGGRLIEANELDVEVHLKNKQQKFLITKDQEELTPEKLFALQESIKFHPL